MARQSTLLITLGGLAAVGMAIAAFLVLTADPAPVGSGGATAANAAPPVDAGSPPADEGAGGRRRARRTGTAVIVGEVRGDAGRAAAVGQEVQLLADGAEPLRTATDSGGSFRFEKLAEGGPYEVRVQAAGFASVRLPGIALDRGETRDVGVLVLDRAVSVTVQVRTLADAPLADAEVLAYASPMSRGFGDWSQAMAQFGQVAVPVAAARTGADGNATLPELAVGSWTFVAQKPGFARTAGPDVLLRSQETPEPVVLHLARGHALAGRVLDGSGPVSGAVVLAASDGRGRSPTAAAHRQRAETGADGSFRIDGLSPGDTTLWAGRADGPQTATLTVRVPDVPRVEIVLPESAVIRGRVTTADGSEPVEGATVRAMAWAGGRGGGFTSGSVAAQARTDAEGHYAIDTLPAGRLQSVTATKEGWISAGDEAPQRGPQSLARLAPGTPLEHDLVLAPGATIAGTVHGPSGPVAGARVRASYASGNRGFGEGTGTTNAAGRYRIDSLPPGRVLVRAEAPALHTPGVPANWWGPLSSGGDLPMELTRELESGAEAELDLTLAAGTVVSGSVRLPSGEPISGVRIDGISSAFSNASGMLRATSADDGTFQLEGVPPGQLQIVAVLHGHSPSNIEPLAVTAGTPAEAPPIVLQPWPVVRGHVTTSSGPLPDDTWVEISVRRARGGARGWRSYNASSSVAPRHPVRTDGSYEVRVPGAEGSFVVTAAAPGFPPSGSDAVTIEPSRGDAPYEVDVELATGHTVEGRVTDARTGEGIAGAHVQLSRKGRRTGDLIALEEEIRFADVSTGGFASAAGGGSGAIIAITDADGTFTIGGLAKGDHEVEARAEGYVTASRGARTPGGGLLSVPLSPELTIRGVLVVGDGSPVESANVTATPLDNSDGARPVSATTDAAGAFELEGLRAGQYALRVLAGWGSRINVQPVEMQPVSAGAQDVRMVAQAGLRVTGRVVDDAGEPVGGAFVNASVTRQGGNRRSRGRARGFNAQTETDGTFELVGLGPDDTPITVNVSARRGGATAYQPARVENVQPGTTGLVIVLGTGLEITGTVTDDAGQSVGQAFLVAEPAGDADGRRAASAMVADDGKFALGGLAPGAYTLSLRSIGRGRAQQLVLVGGASVAAGSTNVRLTATRGATITGVVVDEAGQPVARASVDARRENPNGRFSAGTDTAGRFEISGLETGVAYTVTAVSQGHLTTTVEAITPGGAELRITLREGVVAEGRLVDATGAPLGKTMLFLAPEGSNPDGARPVRTTTDDDGAFRATGLAESVSYKVRAMIRGSGRARMTECGSIAAGSSGVTLRVAE